MERRTLTLMASAFGLAIAVTGTPAAAQTMYKWVDKDGKTNYTDSPPPADAKKLAPPKGSSAPATSAAPATQKGRDDPQDKAQRPFRPEEQAALQVMCGIALMEVLSCQLELKRWCSLDEVLQRIKSTPGGSVTRDPRNDPNYEHRVNLRGNDISISAVPRKPGLASFLNTGEGTHYNFGGPAGPSDRMVSGGNNCAADFRP